MTSWGAKWICTVLSQQRWALQDIIKQDPKAEGELRPVIEAMTKAIKVIEEEAHDINTFKEFVGKEAIGVKEEDFEVYYPPEDI